MNGAPLGEHGEGLRYREKVRFFFYWGMLRSRLWKRVSLSIRAPLGNMGGGVRSPGTWRDS